MRGGWVKKEKWKSLEMLKWLKIHFKRMLKTYRKWPCIFLYPFYIVMAGMLSHLAQSFQLSVYNVVMPFGQTFILHYVSNFGDIINKATEQLHFNNATRRWFCLKVLRNKSLINIKKRNPWLLEIPDDFSPISEKCVIFKASYSIWLNCIFPLNQFQRSVFQV